MLLDCGACDVDATIDATVNDLLSTSRVRRPPVDAIAVADRLGFVVVWDEQQTGRARIAMVASRRGRLPRPTVFLRPDARPERVQWALAHEIGEAAMKNILKRARLNSDLLHDHVREQLANRFAGRLLLPSTWFSASVQDCDMDLFALKQTYTTASHELIAWRMLDLSPPAIVSLFDHGKLQARRSNVPGKVPALSRDEADAWRQAHQTGEAFRRDTPFRIDAWPIHEPDWRREIVRLEVADLGD
jgi:hypothetical protein